MGKPFFELSTHSYRFNINNLLKSCFALTAESRFNLLLSKATAIKNPFKQAFFVIVHFPYLQPFDDVNECVSRLAANIPLIRSNLAPLSFIDVLQRAYTDAILGVYELNETALLKDIFLWAYEPAAAQYAAVRQSLGKPDPFRLMYSVELRAAVAAIIRAKISRREVAKAVYQLSAELIKVSIIDTNPRGNKDLKETLERERKAAANAGFVHPTDQRYEERTVVERVNGRLKDEFGAHHLRVRGHKKVQAHLMFGIVVLCVDQIMRLLI